MLPQFRTSSSMTQNDMSDFDSAIAAAVASLGVSDLKEKAIDNESGSVCETDNKHTYRNRNRNDTDVTDVAADFRALQLSSISPSPSTVFLSVAGAVAAASDLFSARSSINSSFLYSPTHSVTYSPMFTPTLSPTHSFTDVSDAVFSTRQQDTVDDSRDKINQRAKEKENSSEAGNSPQYALMTSLSQVTDDDAATDAKTVSLQPPKIISADELLRRAYESSDGGERTADHTAGAAPYVLRGRKNIDDATERSCMLPIPLTTTVPRSQLESGGEKPDDVSADAVAVAAKLAKVASYVRVTVTATASDGQNIDRSKGTPAGMAVRSFLRVDITNARDASAMDLFNGLLNTLKQNFSANGTLRSGLKLQTLNLVNYHSGDVDSEPSSVGLGLSVGVGVDASRTHNHIAGVGEGKRDKAKSWPDSALSTFLNSLDNNDVIRVLHVANSTEPGEFNLA